MRKLYQLILGIMVLSALLFSGCGGEDGAAGTDSPSGAGAQPSGEVQPSEDIQPTGEVQPSEDIQPTGEVQPSDGEDPSAAPAAFEGTDIEGNAVSSELFSQSKLTMVNVWATYCNPCLSEMPALGELAGEYDAAEFQLIGIISDVMEGADQTLAEELIQQTGADYPHLLLNRSVYDALLTDVSAVPTTFFVDENGTVLGSVIGAREKEAWKEIIDGLLEML